MENLNIDWETLPFGYMKTDYNLRVTFKDGKWGEVEVHDDENLPLHIAATCLHYGQQVFEGMKAFRGADGRIRIFRPEENARRMRDSAAGIMMEPIPEDLFIDMIKRVVKMNERFIPPYGCDSSLYIRPLEIGLSPRIGVSPATEYMFMVKVMPVGPYFKHGFKPTQVVIYRDYDRAAPCGTGRWKVGGNYAAGMQATQRAKANGYAAALFLDPKEKLYIDECGPANFFGIKGNKYITPKSGSILPSITNRCLQQIALDMGMEVECRPIHVEELATLDEAAECGTAAVAAPIYLIEDHDKGVNYTFGTPDKAGPVVTKLMQRLRDIQRGDYPDEHGWVMILE